MAEALEIHQRRTQIVRDAVDESLVLLVLLLQLVIGAREFHRSLGDAAFEFGQRLLSALFGLLLVSDVTHDDHAAEEISAIVAQGATADAEIDSFLRCRRFQIKLGLIDGFAADGACEGQFLVGNQRFSIEPIESEPSIPLRRGCAGAVLPVHLLRSPIDQLQPSLSIGDEYAVADVVENRIEQRTLFANLRLGGGSATDVAIGDPAGDGDQHDGERTDKQYARRRVAGKLIHRLADLTEPHTFTIF